MRTDVDSYRLIDGWLAALTVAALVICAAVVAVCSPSAPPPRRSSSAPRLPRRHARCRGSLDNHRKWLPLSTQRGASVSGFHIRRRVSGSRRRNAFRGRRRPTRTPGDLSEVADASPGITTEDLARDLEAVASKRGVLTESELLADLLRRVERIEKHLGIHES
jgi:hypothetical protein